MNASKFDLLGVYRYCAANISFGALRAGEIIEVLLDMNLFNEFADRLNQLLLSSDLFDQLDSDARASLPFHRIVVEPPRDATHGDLATNAALILSKPLKSSPKELGEKIMALLHENAEELDITSTELAGPGFVNITLKDKAWQEVLLQILQPSADFGKCDLGKGEKVNVEFVSTNPTGPLHIGHCRGAVFGDTAANLLQFGGYDVTREYYINDAGAQVDVLARSAYLRYLEALGEDIGEIPDGLYPGEYLKAVGEALKVEFGSKLQTKDEKEWLPLVRSRSIEAMMQLIREEMELLGIKHDVFFSEKSLTAIGSDEVAELIDVLRDRDLVYEGRLPPPKGKPSDEWEDREQTLFRSTRYGDDVDRALMKSDGSYTYFASDIAYHYDKYKRGFNKMIDVLGADHQGYLKRMTAAVRALSNNKASLDIRFCQIVNLKRGGKPVKMSKRSGNLVSLRDVVAEVGPDVTRFLMLFRKNDAQLDFDFSKAVEQSRENPVFYVQYSYARTCSVMRQAAEQLPDLDQNLLIKADLTLLIDSDERALIQKMAEYPRVIEAAIQQIEPHRVAFYLYELASSLNGLWNKGKDSPQLRFINVDDKKLTEARLALVRAVQTVLRSGLGLLGVNAHEELR